MAQDYIRIYYSLIPLLAPLQPSEIGRLFSAALNYAANGEQPANLLGKEALLWPSLMAQIDEDKSRYADRCKKNKENITKRYERIQSNTTVYDRSKDNNNIINNTSNIESSNTEEKERKNNTDSVSRVNRGDPRGGRRDSATFKPPTLDEVRAYCQERSSPVDPKRFWEYFDAGHWKDSKGNPVKNWKQKLLTWEKFSADQGKKEEPAKPDYNWIEEARKRHAELRAGI